MSLLVQKVPYVEYVELLFDLIAPFVSAYFLYLLRRPVFHLNLRILLANFSIAMSGITLCRAAILIHTNVTFSPTPFWLQVTHDTFAHVLITASILMAGERVIATLYVGIYEKVKGAGITVLVCLIHVFLMFLLAYFCMVWRTDVRVHEEVYIKFSNPQHRNYLLASILTMSSLNVVGFFMFICIYRYNRSRWTIDLSKKLTHRYQIAENMRTSKQLFAVLIGDFVISTYFCFVCLYIFVFQRNDVVAVIIAQLLDLAMATATIVMPMVFIL
ncbi:hypothetical protein L596_028887 [Steinernema carpocapsae]|uniref:G-protein coupled receptors family 1 profile domain-containing protein n=1 Tax=Steinernema carpocapsae TaxID=34508 RepID=A0A4U5LZT5_STECR|nr:hypothetical protein L596_028887 [Steinernema carpocapsae]